MAEPLSVKVSSRNQIAVPRAARERLGISPGDRLLVDIQGGVLVLVPLPADFSQRLAGLHRDIWRNVDVDAYIAEEREAWGDDA